MSRKDDLSLIENSFRALRNSSRLMVDCPKPEYAVSNKWTRVSEGTLTFEVSYDPVSSVQAIIPTLTKRMRS
jgi:hypothetical protein